MLTSSITANTLRDINVEKDADADLLRPMTDKEIFGNILDSMLGGTDTVSKKKIGLTLSYLNYLLRNNFIKINYRRRICLVLSYIFLIIILK
jgi:hypothetical protein